MAACHSVKPSPCHVRCVFKNEGFSNPGFIPRISITWGHSSVGRAIGSQSIGRRFDPACLHQKPPPVQSWCTSTPAALFAQHEQIKPLHFLTCPRCPAQKLQAGSHARVKGKAAHSNTLSQSWPAVVRYQGRQNGFQCHAVQRVTRLGGCYIRRGKWHSLILSEISHHRVNNTMIYIATYAYLTSSTSQKSL